MFSKPAKSTQQLEIELAQVNKAINEHKGLMNSCQGKVIVPRSITHGMAGNYEKRKVALEAEIARRKGSAADAPVKSTL